MNALYLTSGVNNSSYSTTNNKIYGNGNNQTTVDAGQSYSEQLNSAIGIYGASTMSGTGGGAAISAELLKLSK
ncbi:hypothetical protein [Marinitoga aeolica]|uniref:Uncharacterized protein n=1 Tax=Marinitoga aeolica TaxID=2809031 RepID=A0ABY8PT87_9BACT|nr:hypothetical protein [Marinitoga aeolica]WGS65832.1 hypothetical protein JRV97_04590 [Marinitoga aeolica]